MPSADRPETVPRIIPLSSRDNFMPLCHLPIWFISSLRWISTEVFVHDRKAVGALHVIHLGYAQHGGKNSRRDLHGAGLGRCAGRRLRKSGGGGGVEGNVAFDLFQRLVNV